jgi:hypothetical protein
MRSRWSGLVVFIVVLAVYLASLAALDRLAKTDVSAYFDRLAESFLQGRLDITIDATHDLTPHNGKWYVPFPPLPALLLMPWVAISGAAGVNTNVFNVIVGASGAAWAYTSVRGATALGWTQLTAVDQRWLAALFAFGSVNWYLSTIGAVWFLGQVSGAAFCALALALAMRGSTTGAGAALALAMLGRPHLAFAGIALCAITIERMRADDAAPAIWDAISRMLRIGAPMLLAAAGLLAYNVARFGDPLDFGYLTQNIADDLRADLLRYGQFDLRYVPKNLWVMLLAGPIWDPLRNQPIPAVDGMSVLLTMPVLVLLPLARGPRLITLGLCASIGLVLLPSITYYNTGWWQFGYRFFLDVLPLVIVLLGLTIRDDNRRAARALIAFGVVMNGWGAWWFLNDAY